MKKCIYTILALAILVLNSCSNSEDSEFNQKSKVTTFKLSIDKKDNSRIKDDFIYYYVEVYSDEYFTTPANIFISGDSTTNRMSNESGEFSMILDISKDYHFLFFATTNDGCYDISNLQSVTLKQGKNPAEAWSTSLSLMSRTDIINVELTRIVAKLSLYETGKIPENSKLTLSFKQPITFNVATDKIVPLKEGEGERTDTINIYGGIDGTTSSVELYNKDIYILSSKYEAASLIDIYFKMTNAAEGAPKEDGFEKTNIPIRANHITKIEGHFTSISKNLFIVECGDDWDTTSNNIVFTEYDE